MGLLADSPRVVRLRGPVLSRLRSLMDLQVDLKARYPIDRH